MTNPFDWKNQPRKIDMRDLDTANKNSYQQTVVVNDRRAKGIEPSLPYSPKSNQAQPQKFAVDMPSMPMHPRTLKRKREEWND